MNNTKRGHIGQMAANAYIVPSIEQDDSVGEINILLGRLSDISVRIRDISQQFDNRLHKVIRPDAPRGEGIQDTRMNTPLGNVIHEQILHLSDSCDIFESTLSRLEI